MNDWERDDLVLNMGNLLGQCERDVQDVCSGTSSLYTTITEAELGMHSI